MVLFYLGSTLLMVLALMLYFHLAPIWGYPAHIYMKVSCSSIFVIVGMISLFLLQSRHKGALQPAVKTMMYLTFAGLVCGLLGDLFLDVANIRTQFWFYVGLAFFILTHIFYILCLLRCTPLCRKDLGVFAMIFLLGLVVNASCLHLRLPGVMAAGGLIYFAVICAILTKALSFLWADSVVDPAYSWCFLAGAVLFFLSDVLLAITMFGSVFAPWMDAVSGYAYFFAQLLIAFTPTLLRYH